MTFAVKNFTPIGGQSTRGRAPQHFAFRTADALATVQASGYFNSVAYNLEPGDIIWVEVVDDVDAVAAVTAMMPLVVVSSASGVVDTFDASGAADFVLNGQITDISSSGQIYIPTPKPGNIVAVYAAMHGDITGADVVLTVKAPDGTVGTIAIAHAGTITGGVFTTGSAPANTELEAGEAVEIETSGASTGAVNAGISVLIRPKGTDSD